MRKNPLAASQTEQAVREEQVMQLERVHTSHNPEVELRKNPLAVSQTEQAVREEQVMQLGRVQA